VLEEVRMLRKLLVVGVAFLACLLTGRAQLSADDLVVADLQKQIYTVVEKTTPAVVEITRRGTIFSGVIVSPQGHVFTAGHTVTPNQQYTIMLPDGRRLKGQSLGSCEQLRGERVDIGLIKIENATDLPFIPIGVSSNLQVNQPCLSISYPGGQRKNREPLVRFGYVNRSIRKGGMLQTTALMEPGDSGGPLLDLAGRLIGIHSRISAEINQNFDVPIDVFKEYWDQLNVPAMFQTQDGKQLPKLGFFGEDFPEKQGIRILELADGGIAKDLGIQPEDLLTKVNGSSVSTLKELQGVLQEVVKSKPETVTVNAQRGEQQLEYKFPSSRMVPPKADRFPGLDPVETTRQPTYPQLASFASVFSTQESNLDDHCCTITCTTSGERTSLMGVCIAGTSLVVSKNSLLGNELVLVLLRASEPNLAGVKLSEAAGTNTLKRGQILLSPDPNGDGFTSVLGSNQFSSPRQASRGYLGVQLEDYDQGGVILLQVDQGAAQRAGLQKGDVILQVNERLVRNQQEIKSYLRTLDPKTSIKAKVRREATEFEADITLGAPPSDSGHAADLMDKSLRRDGFTAVLSHDALIPTNACGGPVYDLEGRFVGMNIARHSRVRTFFLPAPLIREFVEKHAK
jgi:serine protease Do